LAALRSVQVDLTMFHHACKGELIERDICEASETALSVASQAVTFLGRRPSWLLIRQWTMFVGAPAFDIAGARAPNARVGEQAERHPRGKWGGASPDESRRVSLSVRP
jgi:hypothetical protein